MSRAARQAIVHHVVIQVFVPVRRQFEPPCASWLWPHPFEVRSADARTDQNGDTAAKTASARSSRARLIFDRRAAHPVIAVLDRCWRGRYPSQRPPSRRKRTIPPRKLGGGCRRGGRVAEGGGLLIWSSPSRIVPVPCHLVRFFGSGDDAAKPLHTGVYGPVLSSWVAIWVAERCQ
jgi:hypothetical protein